MESFGLSCGQFDDELVDIPLFTNLSTKNKNWKDNFEEALKHLKENNPNLAEQSLSQALKILSSPPKASHFNREKATCFHTLAEIYSTRASQQLDDNDFCEMMVKSIALFEAERVYKISSYKEEREINAAILEAEVKLINKVFGDDGVERFKKISDNRLSNRTKLDEIRSKVTNEYFNTLSKCPDWSSEEEEEEEKRCKEIESIYEKIYYDMKSFVVDIFRYCIEIAGPAPCEFSIIGLGSMSRQEATPYSDFEFTILIEDNGNASPELRQYFRFLTYFIQVQIIKLGETILPSVGISSLNDFYSNNKEDDWFYDDVIPKGFSFDGMMPWACKTPLGRKEWRGQPKQEYIMTIDEMLKLQDVIPGSMESLKTASVFRSVCHLFGQEKLTKTYQEKLSALVTNTDRKQNFQEQVLQNIQDLLETNSLTKITNMGTQQDVKKEVYRLTSLLVEQLSNFFGIFGQCSWKCIEEMSMKNIFSKDGAKNLIVALSITTELRLKCYQNHGRQKEALPTVPQLSMTEEKNPPCPFTTAIVRLYQSLLPLYEVMSTITKVSEMYDIAEPEPLIVAVLQTVNLMDTSPLTTGAAYLRLLQLPKALNHLLSAKNDTTNIEIKASILINLSRCYCMVGKFGEAIECCREVQTMHSMAPDDVRLLPALTSTMDIYVDQGLYNDAVKMYKQIMDFHERSEGDFQENFDFLQSSAVLFMKIEQYNTAEGIIRDIIERLPNPQRHPLYFECLNNLAVVLLNTDRLTEAKTVLNETLNVANALYGENAIHPYFARCLTNLSEAHFYLQDMEEANRLLQRALTIYSRVHERELIEPGLIDALIIEARIHQFFERWDQMLGPLNKAKEIAEILYRGQPHPNVASIFFHLGCCEQKRANFTEAIKHYQKYLKIHEDQRLECQKSDHDCKTAYVLVIIANMATHCSYDASYRLSCLEKAIDIEEKVHGKECNHGHLAMCFGSLGFCLITVNDESKGLEYLCKAMLMFQEIELDSDQIFGQPQVQQIFGQTLAEHCHNKSENHLRTVKDILKKSLNDDCHVALLEINSSLMNIYVQTNRIQDGLELAKQQKRLIDTMLSKSDVPSALQLCQVYRLAKFFEESGRRNSAKEIYIDLISRLQSLEEHSTHSDEDPFMLLLWVSQLRLGEIYRNNGMFNNAESIFQRIISSVQKKTLTQSFAESIYHDIQINLAAVFVEAGQHIQAYQLVNDIINIYEKNSKSICDETARCAFFLRGELNRRCFRFNHALQDLEKALKVAERCRGASAIRNSELRNDSKIEYARIMNTIGLIYEQSGNLKRALEYYYCCINAVEGLPPYMVTAVLHQNAADVLKKIENLDGALVHYKKSLEIRETLHSEDPVREDIATVLYHIALIQYTDGKLKDAFETLEKLIPLRKELLKKENSFLANYAAVFVLKGNCHIKEPGEAQQAKEAFEEAERVLKILTEGQLNLDYARVLGNLGYACFLLNEWQQAIPKLQNALEMKRVFYKEEAGLELAANCHLLATAFLKHQEYKDALPHFQEALKYFEVNQFQDEEMQCVLNIALCYKGLKNVDCTFDNMKRVEEMCLRKSENDRTRLDIHQTMADIYTEEEYADRCKLLHHLKDAENILMRMKRSEKDEETLSEIQAKIFSLDIV